MRLPRPTLKRTLGRRLGRTPGRKGKEEDREGEGVHSRRGAKAYQWALESSFSILIGVGIGYWADSYFDTSPILLLVGLVLGFGAFVRGLLRIRKLVEEEAGEATAPPADES